MSSASAPVDLAYTVVGDGEPVVLIMGINAPGAAWEPHVRHWSATFRCIVVDNRGAGASPAPDGPYSSALMADDYAALIRRLGLGPSRIVGISLGGAIAQELALRHPDLVRSLVLVASWARTDAYTSAVLDTIAEVRLAASDEVFSEYLQTLVWTPGWFGAHSDELAAGRQAPLAVERHALAAQVAACLSHDAVGRLGSLAVPVLVTAGDADRFIPHAVSLALAEAIPGSRFETFEGSGHVHHWEHLERFNTLVAEWLAA